MKKEFLLAVFIGIIFGLGITTIFWARQEGKLSLNFSLPFGKSPAEPTQTDTDQTEPAKETASSKKPEVQGETSIKLNIIKPVNESVKKLSKIVLSGETEANAIVVIIMPKEEKTIISSEDGSFETEIELNGGENIISVSVFDDQGNTASKKITVIHSTSTF